MTDTIGNLLIAFHYDAYGTAVYTTHDSTLAPILAQVNPLGYRGYVMDSGTGLYYLQSRYYDTAWGRFINADALVTTGQGLLGNNMFAYCLNNPVMLCDPTGMSSHNAAQPWLCDCASCNTSTAVTYYYYGDYYDDGKNHLAEFWETINNHFIRQQETEIQIIMQQNKLIQQGASALWDAYNTGYSIQQNQYMTEAQMMIDNFSTVDRAKKSLAIVGAELCFIGSFWGGPIVGGIGAGLLFLATIMDIPE